METTIVSKIKRYNTYKDSGVEWLGKIPKNWEVKRLKYFGSIFSGLSGKKGDDFSKEYSNEFKEFIPFTNICNNSIISKEEYQYVKLADDEYQNRVKNKDILFLMSSETLDEIAKTSIYLGNDEELYLNSFCKGFRIQSSNLFPEYINYLLSSSTYRKYFEVVGRGFTRINIQQDYINNVFITIPTLSEQTAIAEFLDDKTEKIDQGISIKEQQIALLKERKQILIHKAVTRGLDDSVPLKDSGVEWIGEIPEHWEVRRFKFLCDITTGAKNTEDKIESGKYPFYVRSQTPEKINSYSFDGEAILTAGDGAGVGKVFHYVNEKFDFHQRVYKFSQFKNIKGKLLFYYLRDNFHNVALTGEAKSTVDSLRLPLIQNFLVTIPPIAEQKEIIETIELVSQKIDTAISLKQQEIERLKEYKSSLINSVVTGRVRVS